MNKVKYIINPSFKAIFKGEFSQASEVDGEFEYNAGEESSLSAATLHEIAKANGLKISTKAKKSNVIEQLNAHLETLNINEVSNMTDTQKVEESIATGMEAGWDDDKIMLDIVNKGVSFKAAGLLFKKVMEDKGFRVTAKERAEKAAKILKDAAFGVFLDDDDEPMLDDEGNVVVLTTKDVDYMVATIAKEVPDTTDKQALAAIRKYAKEQKFDLPKAKKGGGSGTGATGINKKVGEFMLANRECDEAAIAEFIRSVKEDITDSQLKKYVANAVRALEFAKAWATPVPVE